IGGENIISRIADKTLTEDQHWELWDIYNEQFKINSGDATMDSFDAWFWIKNTWKKTSEAVDFFFTNFNLYYEDPIGNLVIHGGIPILPDGSIIGDIIGGEFSSGFEYVKRLNEGFKNGEFEVLERLATGADGKWERILNEMKIRGLLNNEEIASRSSGEFLRYFIPTWFDNSVYEKTYWDSENYITPLQSLRSELDKIQKERLIVGHWHVDSWDFHDTTSHHASLYNGTILRLDRSWIRIAWEYWNFGFAIVDSETNWIEEMGDAIHLFQGKSEDL
ncbi:MAG: hypothetical protein ACD_71C00104G0010, partial [uncultured bacterium (gcode 4)]